MDTAVKVPVGAAVIIGAAVIVVVGAVIAEWIQ